MSITSPEKGSQNTIAWQNAGSQVSGVPVHRASVMFVRLIATSVVLLALNCSVVAGLDVMDDPGPIWEPLLWGGKISKSARIESGTRESPSSSQETSIRTARPSFIAPSDPSVLVLNEGYFSGFYYRSPFRNLVLKNIPPLYLTPELPGEGVWEWRGLPTDPDGRPLMYRTSYRPSEKYPNAIAHMLLFDMKRLTMKLYLGSGEPGGSSSSSVVEPTERKRLVAITNALWKQKHSGDAGTVASGRVIRELRPGMATLAIYEDGSVDILEWNPGVPVSLLRDVKQLRHLIVKDGKVVNSIMNGGKPSDSEIGLGYLLSETDPMPGYQYWQGWWGGPSETTSGPDWFIATRSAFGIRKDGNLVFAIGHHISTKDLAKALVLAGCERAIHGDANPHNVLANFYFTDGNGNFTRKEKLSPEQKSYTLDRYVERSYTSDFYGFFIKPDQSFSIGLQ